MRSGLLASTFATVRTRWSLGSRRCQRAGQTPAEVWWGRCGSSATCIVGAVRHNEISPASSDGLTRRSPWYSTEIAALKQC